MSYASVLAENAPPVENQPKPDHNLLEGQGNHQPPHESTSDFQRDQDDEREKDRSNPSDDKPERQNASENPKKKEKKTNKVVHDSEKNFKVVSLLNLLALSGTALVASKYWHQPVWDKRVVSGFLIGFGVLFGSQGYFGKSFYNLIRKQE